MPHELREVSPRQLEVLEYIDEHIHEHGYSPTIREIADAFGWASTRAVMDHLIRLVRHGLVRRDANKARSTVLTTLGVGIIEGRKQCKSAERGLHRAYVETGDGD